MSSNLTKALIVLVVLVVVAVVIRLRMGPSDAKPSPSVGGYGSQPEGPPASWPHRDQGRADGRRGPVVSHFIPNNLYRASRPA